MVLLATRILSVSLKDLNEESPNCPEQKFCSPASPQSGIENHTKPTKQVVHGSSKYILHVFMLIVIPPWLISSAQGANVQPMRVNMGQHGSTILNRAREPLLLGPVHSKGRGVREVAASLRLKPTKIWIQGPRWSKMIYMILYCRYIYIYNL